MKNIFRIIFTALFCTLLQGMVAVTSYAASPMGYWKTIDDVTGKVKSIIKIDGSPSDLSGTVVRLFPGALTICSACEADLKNKPIMGMTVMSGMKQDADDRNKWSDGTILDPKTGKTYHCTITVAEDDRTLNVRGYIGISLIGRSQTWIRVSGK